MNCGQFILDFVKPIARSIAVIIGSVFLCAIVWFCWAWHRMEGYQQGYLRVQRGDSQEQVIALCGQPSLISTEVETNLMWEEVFWTNGNCIQQFHYYPPFSICGESWQIGFDKQSNVISKFHFLSP